MTVQPREGALSRCWCDDCTRLATLVPHPTQIVETVWGPRLPADSCTEADTATAWARWCSQHTGGAA